MNKISKLFLLLVSSAIFSGCNLSTNIKAEKTEKATVRIHTYANDSSRTAIPTINWENYTYELKVIENPGEASQKPEIVLFNNRSYEDLAVAFKIDLGKYKFSLGAYKDGVKILSGAVTIDLTSGGNKTLSFRMFAVSGSTGSAEVTITFPIDGAVAKVEGKVSATLFGQDSGNEIKITDVAGERRVIFAADNLPANTEQYALFWFYDAAGTVIYSCAESLMIVGGETSVSSIKLETKDWHTYNCGGILNKDNSPWASSGKSISLVDKLDSNKKYPLKDMGSGNFAASVAEGTYYVYVDDVNTEKEFESRTKNFTLEYYSVTAAEPVKGWRLSIISGAVANGDKDYAVLKGNTLKYKIEKERGYESTSLVIKQNDVAMDSSEFAKTYTIENIKAPQTISVSGVKAIEYTITYKLDSAAGSDAKWRDGVIPVTKFTAENVEVLPTIADLLKTGGMFDVWVSKNDSTKVYKTTEGVYENLELVGKWKDAPSVNTKTKVIYANGINLIIAENAGATNAYIDLNGDGFIDPEVDLQIEATDGTKDFTNYTLRAGNSKGTEINSDFTFTVTGGQIKSIYGLDSVDVKRSNKSVLNISGNAKIGSANPVEHKDEFGNTYYTAEAVNGVMLETITNECVNITGEMEGDYSVICIAPFVYEENVVHDIAIVGNSEWTSYSGFFSYNYDEENSIYNQQRLTFKNKNVNGVTKTYIRLADPVGVVLPKVDEITGDVTFGFTLGNDCVTTECSVFSVMVEDGFFSVDSRTTFTKNQSDEEKAIEDTLTYMVQPTASTYETSLAFKDASGNVKNYVYLQILSSGNQLTPETASDFLSQVRFRRNPETPDVPLKVKVNLETFPAEEINKAGVQYYNGSFYKLVKTKSNWLECYKAAKGSVVNGLHGYLMNITSLVENNYIFNKLQEGVDKSPVWTGGTRMVPAGENYDPDIWTWMTTEDDADYGRHFTTYRWSSGPEAGDFITDGTVTCTDGTKKTGYVSPSEYSWGSGKYSKTTTGKFTNWNGGEPNDSDSGRKGEECIHYLKTSKWNDYSYYNTVPVGYVVEYTPYESDYGKETASYQSITREASY